MGFLGILLACHPNPSPGIWDSTMHRPQFWASGSVSPLGGPGKGLLGGTFPGEFPLGQPGLVTPPCPHPCSPPVQFSLLHSKFHLCSVATRALLLSTYIKFINLFPETKATIQGVLRAGSQLRNADVELQQRAVEYLTLSSVASTDVLVRALCLLMGPSLSPDGECPSPDHLP